MKMKLKGENSRKRRTAFDVRLHKGHTRSRVTTLIIRENGGFH